LSQKDIAIGPRWAIVLDEAWEDFPDTYPPALPVVVTDEPGDKDLRVSSNIGFVWIADLVIRRQVSDLHICSDLIAALSYRLGFVSSAIHPSEA
jgi:hypothetical protein